MLDGDESVGALDQDLWDGINKFLDDFASVQPGDNVVIAYTPDSRVYAAWVHLACEDRGLASKLVFMAPLRDSTFCERLSRLIDPRPLARRNILLTFEKHTMSHNKIIKSVFSGQDVEKYRVVRAINSSRELFLTGMETAPNLLSALNATVIERCRGSRKIRITAPGGTDLTATIDSEKYQYKSSRGVHMPGKFMVVPPGEVATFPASISGRLVADFALNVNMFFDGDVRLDRYPVVVDVEDGEAIRFHCENSEMAAFLEKGFARPNAKKVGELGFGTNPAVTRCLPENSHLNERVPGVHLGFGQHNQTDEVAGYACDIHIDLCAKGGVIEFDDDPYPLDLEKVPPSRNPHPNLISGEDVFSDDAEDDCCGLIRYDN
jgi:leucyl aminopeptidase (aminopeptidase T)